MDKLLYGAAYYDEYMPYERLEQDIWMMKKAGMNVIRIAESTWSTEEPEEGVFDFSHVTRVLDVCEREGMSVIIGTPTYAIPVWMARRYPEVMVTDKTGQRPYGARQIMDITHPAYLFYCERIIRRLLEAVSGYSCVIGFQLDNETKHFGTSSENVQQMFVRWMKKKFKGDIEALNQEFGLAYWSNKINSWEEFPNVKGTINGSLGCEFEKFQRSLVTDFLNWQSSIVREYKKEDQFITHNFDFAWKGHSFGVQTDVDHFEAAKTLTIAGCDIYHPTQEALTGKEIAFCGDLTRSLKKKNYLVIETEAQGFPEWTPYKGQLRLQAFSHLASGANSVMYWHWHSIHNACETYWKGVLSHDLQENDVYREACTVGKLFAENADKLHSLKKSNKVAVMVSNESLTAMKWFPLPGGNEDYNDIVRWIYDSLYEMNVECDIISAREEDLSAYDILFVPAMYSAKDEQLERIMEFAKKGGIVAATFKTAFTDENVKVRAALQPYKLEEAFGIQYDQFTAPVNTRITGDDFELSEEDRIVSVFMELVKVKGAKVLSAYDHYMWKDYAAVTKASYGEGTCYYFGCKTSKAYVKALTCEILRSKELWTWKQKVEFPVVIREGRNKEGKTICYLFNYSGSERTVLVEGNFSVLISKGMTVEKSNTELASNSPENANLSQKSKPSGEIHLGAWDFCVLEMI